MLKNKAEPKRRWLDLAPGDPVIVIAGKDKGKQGEVLRTIPDQHKIVVKGVNILKRHSKAGQSRGGVRVAQGGIVDFEAPLDYSNVMLVCPSCGLVHPESERFCAACGVPLVVLTRRRYTSCVSPLLQSGSAKT